MFSDVNEATVYDDGYNRKKSKKRKRKQSVPDKEKRESKSKKRANKINTQNMNDIQFEIKTEVEDDITGSFEDVSQENIDEIPVLQGSYNDSIIIENKTDSLKIEEFSEFSESSDRYVKKKKKHSKHSEQKKLKPKHVSKNKRKQDSTLTFDHTSPFNISDTDVHCKNATLPEICIPRCSIKDISTNQGKVNVLPGNIISVGNELSMINVKDKTVVNITNSGQMMHTTHGDDKNIEKLTNNTVENKITTSTTMNIKNVPIRSVEKSATITTHNLCAVAHKGTNFECQNEGAKPTVHNINTSTSTNYKNLLKAPKLSILKTAYDASRLTPQVQVDNSATNQKDVRLTVDVPKTWTSQEMKQSMPFLTNSIYNKGPPVLQNELISRCDNIRSANFKSPLENIKLPAGTVINQICNTGHSIFSNYILPPSRPAFHQHFTESKPKKSNLQSGSKTLIKEINWGNTSLKPSEQTSIVRLTPVSAPSNPDNIRVSSTVSNIILPANMSFVPAHSMSKMYGSTQITPIDSNKTYFLSTANFSTNSPSLYSKTNRLYQKSQRGEHTKRKKPSARSVNKSKINNPSSNVSQKNITNTSVGTQIELIGVDPPCVDTSLFRVTNSIIQHATHLIDDSSSKDKSVIANPAQCKQNECTTTFDNKTQLPNLQKQVDSINPRLLISNPKSKKVTIVRKSKEKLKKITMEKKELSTTITSENIKEQSALIPVADVQPCKTQTLSMIPGHISDMIYPNVPNSKLLKAFNDYWSAQISHCAICATFASCSSGSSRVMPPDWKYCKSVTIPESTPIWVKEFL